MLQKPEKLLTHRTTKTAALKTLILGMGNPMRGDDAIGIAILEALSESDLLPNCVTLLENYKNNMMDALLFQEYERVIIVDAGLIGRSPGEWKRLILQDSTLLAPNIRPKYSLHPAGLAGVVVLAETMRISLPEIIVYAVQPLNIGWSLALSEPARRAIPEVCDAILNDLKTNPAYCNWVETY